MTKKMLEKLGYTVETRLDPLSAVELFKSDPAHFDLVITDMAMPKMTGDTLARRLIDIRPDIPVIICTGYSALIDADKAKNRDNGIPYETGYRINPFKSHPQRTEISSIAFVLCGSIRQFENKRCPLIQR